MNFRFILLPLPIACLPLTSCEEIRNTIDAMPERPPEDPQRTARDNFEKYQRAVEEEYDERKRKKDEAQQRWREHTARQNVET